MSTLLRPTDRLPDGADSGQVPGPVLVDLLVATTAVLVLAAPMLFTRSGFMADFTNHLWLTWAAGHALVEAGHPSYFLNTANLGVFDPWFAFYGGTLYTVVGGISELIGGHPVVAYVGATTVAIAATYGGMLWLARGLGLTRLASHAPAIVVVTSAYYVTDLYGRGAWPEFIAAAAIAPLLASAIHLVRIPAWRPLPALVFALSVVAFSGSHNISLLWGAAIGVLVSFIAWVASGMATKMPLRRMAMVAGLGFVSVGVNAWYLLPDIVYSHFVQAYATYTRGIVAATFLDTPSVLFDPLRHVPRQSSTPALFVQAPDWFLAWGLVTGAVLLWRRPAGDMLRRGWLASLVLIALIVGMITISPFWNLVPALFTTIQFPYRLGTYLVYATAGLVLVGCLSLREVSTGTRQRLSRRLHVGLAGVCAVSIGLCLWQLWVPNTLFPGVSYSKREEALVSTAATPRTWYDQRSYNDHHAPVVSVPTKRLLIIEPSAVRGDRLSAWVQAPPGMAPIQTNIAGGSYLVHLAGLTWIGRDAHGFAVVRRLTNGSGPVHIVLETSHSVPVELGRAISILACLAILVVLLYCGYGYRRGQRRIPTLSPQ
jgi:hypothetical protein